MTPLEKILEKCEFSEQKVWRDCGYDDESEPGVKQIIGGGKAVHLDLMPIIRELCAIIEEQQGALQGANTYLRDIFQLERKNILKQGEPVSIHEAYEFAKDIAASGYRESGEILDSTSKRLAKLAGEEKL